MAKFTVDAKYLVHADLSDHEDTVLTIKSYEQEMMGQGKDAQDKWVLYFREIKKGLGLNKTNGKMCCKLFASDNMDDWIGKKIAIYVKDDVEFQGDIVSAIRVRSKLPGEKGEPIEEDYSTLTYEETCHRLARAESLKELGGLMAHGTKIATDAEIEVMKGIKDKRVNHLMGL